MSLPQKYIPPALARQSENKRYGLFVLGENGLSCIGGIVFITLKQALDQIGADKWYIVKVHPKRKILYFWSTQGYWEASNSIITSHTKSYPKKDATKIVEKQIHKKTKKKSNK